MLTERREQLKQERRRTVEKAEREDGYREGTFRHAFNGSLCRVEVSFYPTRKWHISVLNESTGLETGRRLLTKALWERLRPAIKLKD